MCKFLIPLAILMVFTQKGFSNPYNEEEVTFVNRTDGVRLAGTLTWPCTEGPFPAVILLHGSLPFDRDCTHLGRKFFLAWADYLTRQGIAVLRFDKRSAGKSTGNYDTATIEDFALDALAGVEYLKARQEIQQIGLVGHSEGGMTAALAASQSEDVAFIVMMGAPCVNLEKIMREQVALIHRADKVDEETIALHRQILQEIFAVITTEKDRERAAKQIREVLREHFDRLTIAQKTAIGTIDEQINSFNSVSFRYVLTYNPAVTLRKVKVPVLALFGELDTSISSKQNLPPTIRALAQGGNKDYTVLELPNINHVFQTCQTGSPKEYTTIEEITTPAVLRLLSEWILLRNKGV